jgi:MFS family permease
MSKALFATALYGGKGARAGGAAPSVAVLLLPITAVVLGAFLVVGTAIPVLALHVRDALGFGPFMIGVVTGCQFAASLATRVWSGRTADARGAKQAVMIGLSAACAAGLLYLLSLRFVSDPRVSVAILLAGRAILGGAESFIITGATTWGLARAGTHNAGKVISWIGTAMFAAFAVGAPLGTVLYHAGGFGSVAAATALAPLATLLLVALLHGAAPADKANRNILSVVRQIWIPGLGAALSSIGFGAIIAFASVLFVEQGWTPVWLPFTAYAAALIGARLVLGHLPDNVGGPRVALWSVLVEATGLVLIGFAPSAAIAALGAALTGLGYALVFPAFGVEAVRRAPAESRGLAMGAYTACLDLALGISGPALGLVASGAGFGAVFLAAALTVLCSAGIAVRLLRELSLGA